MSNITRKQNKNLIITVAKLVTKYKKNEDVECIYLLPYTTENENFYNLVIVCGTYETIDKLKNSIEESNKKQKHELEKVKIGGELRILTDYSARYEERALNPSRVGRVQDLLSSRILYTKNGYGRYYHRVAHQFDKYNTVEKYNNRFRIAIPEEQKKKMKKIERSSNV